MHFQAHNMVQAASNWIYWPKTKSDNKYNTNLNHIPAKSQGVFKINLTAVLNFKSVSITNSN